ncbi:MAG: hypothetical protein R6V54_11610 [Desulfobacteraceae bacterium]
MIRNLSSIRVTFIALTLLFLLLISGIAMSSLFGCRESFAAMNQTIVWVWLKSSWQKSFAVTMWLLAITATALVLLANIVCCTFGKQLKTAVKAATIQRWLFFFSPPPLFNRSCLPRNFHGHRSQNHQHRPLQRG